MKHCEFTLKREILLETIVEDLKPICKAIVLTGSLSYAPNEHVKEDSDIDLILLTEDLKSTGKSFISLKKHRVNLDKRFFDGYCIKSHKDGIPISYHILSMDAFDIITKCYVANIRVFRQKKKDGKYLLKNFHGEEFSYEISNKALPEFKNEGFRTIVPISFIKSDKYYNGVYRDKLLCSPRILYDPQNIVSLGLEKLWKIVVMNLKDESLRLNGRIKLSKMSIFHSLAKGEKLNDLKKKNIKSKTKSIIRYLSQ